MNDLFFTGLDGSPDVGLPVWYAVSPSRSFPGPGTGPTPDPLASGNPEVRGGTDRPRLGETFVVTKTFTVRSSVLGGYGLSLRGFFLALNFT